MTNAIVSTIRIVHHFNHGRGAWEAILFQGVREITRADGRNLECAVADVVAKFRTSRGARKTRWIDDSELDVYTGE